MARFVLGLGWLAGCFRCTPFALLAAAALLSSCSTAPQRTATRYVAPSVAPVRSKIAEASASVTKAITVHAKAATEKLVQLETLTAATPELHDLAAGAHSDIDALTQELTIAQAALAAAETKAAELQVLVDSQADQLNAAVANADHQHELAVASEAKAAAAARWRNRFAILSAGLLAWIFRRQLLQLLSLLGKAAGVALHLLIP
jgi:hypothetical protein